MSELPELTDDVARELGFADLSDLFSLIPRVNLMAPDALAVFKAWQFQDGTKEGLLNAFPYLRAGAT